MNIHEYQAKQVLKSYGTPILDGVLATTPAEARKAAEKLGGPVWVVKAQIHAGGRGKAGGVKLAKSVDEVESLTKEMIGKTLVTHQTGPEGKEVLKVYIEKGCDIAKEYYVAILVDRHSSKTVIMASSEGGMDIEEVAAKTPEKIHTEVIEPVTGLTAFQCRKLAFKIGMQDKVVNKAVKSFMSLYQAFVEKDASMAEINPLVETKQGDVITLDAKMNFDSNALYRHPEILELRDLTEEEPSEIEASKYDLAFIKLDGNIGCLVNGAGLAMSTMDIIKLNGGEPANFLDVGGGANKEKVTAAFKIILNDKNVKGILVNIFGGIMKCDIIAEGVIAATQQLGLTVPLVVRLAGTNVEKGKELLANSGLNIIPADDLNDAARKIVEAVKGK
ncbi:MAG: ADP-forming succinate--CoA ligase subunit beta [Bdellovibrionaceae bacterium]|nr:ADP-forming succinate--CoA ligase subunit beta [Pseudobdellovibrionaceae bacterium]